MISSLTDLLYLKTWKMSLKTSLFRYTIEQRVSLVKLAPSGVFQKLYVLVDSAMFLKKMQILPKCYTHGQ